MGEEVKRRTLRGAEAHCVGFFLFAGRIPELCFLGVRQSRPYRAGAAGSTSLSALSKEYRITGVREPPSGQYGRAVQGGR